MNASYMGSVRLKPQLRELDVLPLELLNVIKKGNLSFTFFHIVIHDYPCISHTLHNLFVVDTVVLNNIRELNNLYFAGCRLARRADNLAAIY
jgi:hypothetical protein